MLISRSERPRDFRLDFFRGLALLLIFIDHIPNTVYTYFTLHAVGFCDAAEVFVFCSGYAASVAYGGTMRQRGFVYATAQVFHRVFQLYLAHIFLFVVFTAEVSYTMMTTNNPMYSEEMGVGQFLAEPHIAVIKAMLLQFQPEFLDILPLYITLLMIFPLVLVALARHPLLALVPAAALYVVSWIFEFGMPGYPDDRNWYFNPFAWQFLFVIGAACGHHRAIGHKLWLGGRWLVRLAMLVVVVAAIIRVSWTMHELYDPFPGLLLKTLFPLNKTDLSPLRLIHFLALALLAAKFVRPDGVLASNRLARPVIRCGQNSLHVFCEGILLSVLGHFMIAEISDSLGMQTAICLAGIALMLATAAMMAWYKKPENKGARGSAPLGAQPPVT